MKLSWPIKNVSQVKPIAPTGGEIYVSQWFGEKWIANKDTKVNGVQIKKGDDVYKKVFGWNGHNGIDIVAPRGTTIYASHPGYIIEATEKTEGYGIRSSLYFEADGKEFVLVHGHLLDYSPLPEVLWDYYKRTVPVKRYQTIGSVGSTGFSTGDHLHWGLYEYRNGIKLNTNNGYGGAIDPRPYLTINLIPEPMKLYIDRRTTPPTIVPGLPVDNADNLKWFASQNGYELPLLSNGDIDWSQVKYDGEIK